MTKILIAIHLAGWFVYMLGVWYRECGDRCGPMIESGRLAAETLIGATWEFSLLPGVIAGFVRGIVHAIEEVTANPHRHQK